MSELKPCPFCGETVSLDYSELPNKKHWYITCDCCGMMYQAVVCQRKDTKTGWNNRPIEDELRKRIAELESENGRLQESWLWETVCPDGSLRPKVSELLLNLDGWKERSNGWESIVETLNTRIAELEALVERLIEAGEKMQALIGWSTGDEATKDWDALVKDWEKEAR